MTTANFKRARRPEQKAQRRESILAAAAELLAEEGLEGVSLNGIARRAGLAKSNVYRYFERREEILLTLLIDDWSRWVTAIERRLAPWDESDDVEAVVGVLQASLVARPRLCALLSVLASTLEQTLGEETVYAFKLETSTLEARIITAIDAALPSLDLDGATRFVRAAIPFIAGLWPLAHPSEATARALTREGLRHERVDLDRDLGEGLSLLLFGALARAT